MSGKRVLVWSLPLALASADVLSLGLGGIQTQSALNQPFRGELELIDVDAAELDTVRIRLAPPGDFDRAGMERYQYLTGLRFVSKTAPDGRVFVQVSSREPIREPYMDFLIEAVWPRGRLVKGYTVLLDPPVTRSGAPTRIQEPRAGSGQVRQVAADGAQTARPALAAPPPGAVAADAFPLSYGPVPRGIGLWRLVQRNLPAGATAAQTAMALYRSNQDAFVRGNINRLRAGLVLTIPSRSELFALDAATAEREFAAALRGERVRQAPLAASDMEPETGDGSRLRIAGLPQRPDAAAAPAPVPADTRAPAAAGASPETPPGTPPGPLPEPGMQQDILLALETSESAQQEAVELRQRIRELETQLSDIQRLLQLRNAELEGVRPADTPVPGALGGPVRLEQPPALADEVPIAPTAPAVATVPASDAPDAAAADHAPGILTDGPALTEPGSVEPDVSRPTDAPSVSGEDSGAPATPGVDSAATAESTADTGGAPTVPPAPAPLRPEPPVEPPAAPVEPFAPPSPAEPVTPVTPVTPTPAPTPAVSADAPPPAFDWREWWLPLAGLFGSVGLGLIAILALRRRRRAPQTAPGGSRDRELGVAMRDVERAPAGGAEAARAASASPSLEQTQIAPVVAGPVPAVAPAPAADLEELLSEADIYIAYGRHDEAVQLLRGALESAPERWELPFKLAEAYWSSGRTDDLERLMATLREEGLDRAHPEEWSNLTTLIQTEPLFGLGDLAALEPEAAVAATPDPTPPAVEAPEDTAEALPAFERDISPSSASHAEIDLVIAPNEQAPPDDALADRLRLPEVAGDVDTQDPFAGLDLGSGPAGGAALDLELTLDDPRLSDAAPVPPASERILPEPEPGLPPLSEPIPDVLPDVLPAPLPAEGAPLARSRPAMMEEGEARVTPAASSDSGFPSLMAYPAAESSQRPDSTNLLSSQWQGDSAIWDDNATKLDLARAYLEMADGDSAREILQEVVADGREDQRQEARALLQQLEAAS